MKRILADLLPWASYEPGAMGIRLSACPKKSDSPSFPAFWKAQMMETPAQRTLSAVPVSSHTPSGTDGASCPEFPSHEALAPFASVPQRNDASGFLRFPLFFVALQSASQFHNTSIFPIKMQKTVARLFCLW